MLHFIVLRDLLMRKMIIHHKSTQNMHKMIVRRKMIVPCDQLQSRQGIASVIFATSK
jgi:hypothetical protein